MGRSVRGGSVPGDGPAKGAVSISNASQASTIPNASQAIATSRPATCTPLSLSLTAHAARDLTEKFAQARRGLNEIDDARAKMCNDVGVHRM